MNKEILQQVKDEVKKRIISRLGPKTRKSMDDYLQVLEGTSHQYIDQVAHAYHEKMKEVAYQEYKRQEDWWINKLAALKSNEDDTLLQSLCEVVENSYRMSGLSDSGLYECYAKDVAKLYYEKKREEAETENQTIAQQKQHLIDLMNMEAPKVEGGCFDEISIVDRLLIAYSTRSPMTEILNDLNTRAEAYARDKAKRSLAKAAEGITFKIIQAHGDVWVPNIDSIKDITNEKNIV